MPEFPDAPRILAKMHRRFACAALLTLAALFMLPRLQPTRRGSAVSPDVAPGEVVVRLQADALALSDDVLSRQLGGEVVERLPELDSLRLRLPAAETPQQAVRRLQRLPEVELAEPNLRLHST